ncbi:hypothetical protein GNF10_35990 [Nostoc sp. UCD121]|nr:hypothetical protein [Nostoc sp. UCD121]MBC1219313.1 hypothetical protein [Nostoc sp. UCD120]MBC1281181.1 hypothetical protein [Nostoc sp. UCD121]MBC1297330.1 hypothetical protein [Nostoc sp. UCD122]
MGETPIAQRLVEKTALPCLCGSLRQAEASTFFGIIYSLEIPYKCTKPEVLGSELPNF